MLFRWFLDVPIDASGFDHSVFSKDRKRLLEQDVAQEFFERVVELARKENLLSDEHFTADGFAERRAALKLLDGSVAK